MYNYSSANPQDDNVKIDYDKTITDLKTLINMLQLEIKILEKMKKEKGGYTFNE